MSSDVSFPMRANNGLLKQLIKLLVTLYISFLDLSISIVSCVTIDYTQSLNLREKINVILAQLY